jgi:NADH dehydrogenase (ubiquinone) 1 beta subcomplex subunit 9
MSTSAVQWVAVPSNQEGYTDICRSLYRRSLKLALDWAVHRQVWRGQAVYIRSLFEANKDVRDPRQQQV